MHFDHFRLYNLNSSQDIPDSDNIFNDREIEFFATRLFSQRIAQDVILVRCILSLSETEMIHGHSSQKWTMKVIIVRQQLINFYRHEKVDCGVPILLNRDLIRG